MEGKTFLLENCIDLDSVAKPYLVRSSKLRIDFPCLKNSTKDIEKLQYERKWSTEQTWGCEGNGCLYNVVIECY